MYGIVGFNYGWIKRSVTEPDTSIDKEYDMFLLFLFYYARQAQNFENQLFPQNKSQLQWFKEKTFLQSKFCCKLKSSISKQWVHSVVTRREPKTTFPLNFFLMAVLNYSVVLASELFCCLLTRPFEEKPFAFSLYISFEESISYRVYSRVDNL